MSKAWPMLSLGAVLGSVNRREPADQALGNERRISDIRKEIRNLLQDRPSRREGAKGS